MSRIALIALIAACGSEPPPPKSRPAPQDARPTAADPPPEPAEDLPADCGLYKALVKKLATCEKLGPQRTLLVEQFETSWKAWTSLPQSERAGVAAGCRHAGDAVRAAASGPCGW